MLNLQDFCLLLSIPIGAVSSMVNAHDMKAGTLAIILFGFVGSLLGFGGAAGIAALSFKLRRHWKKMPSIIYGFLCFFSILAAGGVPNLLVLIIYGHK